MGREEEQTGVFVFDFLNQDFQKEERTLSTNYMTIVQNPSPPLHNQGLGTGTGSWGVQ